MSIPQWNPPVELDAAETRIIGRLSRVKKLYAFLRRFRHVVFNPALQEELAGMYRQSGAGKPPKPPAQLAMVVLLQVYTGASDAEAVELALMDRRWQLVLGCLGAEDAPFSQGALQDFRERLIRTNMDRRLLERSIEVAKETKAFDWKKLQSNLGVAMDSSPLEGAGRVEDTFNLLGHAARKIVECVAALAPMDPAELAMQAGIPLLSSGKSLKAALDIDWSNGDEKVTALTTLVHQLDALDVFIKETLPGLLNDQPLAPYIQALQQVRTQNVETKDGQATIKQGVAPDRRISIEDGDMRHGRKSKSQRINGYKRHLSVEIESGLVLGCDVTPANQPEECAADVMNTDIEHMGLEIQSLHIDLGYLASPLVSKVVDRGGTVVSKPWTVRAPQPGMFSKTDFKIDTKAHTITCPAGNTEPFEPGETVHFPPEECGGCPVRSKCTLASVGRGRSISIAEDEERQQQLRKIQKTQKGRAGLRQRVVVEHRLAHLGARQGDQARYQGIRKNIFDVRRAATVMNLEIVHGHMA